MDTQQQKVGNVENSPIIPFPGASPLPALLASLRAVGDRASVLFNRAFRRWDRRVLRPDQTHEKKYRLDARIAAGVVKVELLAEQSLVNLSKPDRGEDDTRQLRKIFARHSAAERSLCRDLMNRAVIELSSDRISGEPKPLGYWNNWWPRYLSALPSELQDAYRKYLPDPEPSDDMDEWEDDLATDEIEALLSADQLEWLERDRDGYGPDFQEGTGESPVI